MIWYLVLSLSQGVIALPQTNHAQCIENRGLTKEGGVYRAYCIKGAPGLVVSGSHVEDDD